MYTDPLTAESSAIRERVNAALSGCDGNSVLSKKTVGDILVLTGAHSATGLRPMPAHYIILEEVDAYPASEHEEGDPLTLTETQTTTFAHRRKVVMASPPDASGPEPLFYALPAERCYAMVAV